MAAFLAGKLVREKNGRFGKAWLGKRGGSLWQGRKRKLSESVEIVESAKTSVLYFSKCEFPVTDSDEEDANDSQMPHAHGEP